jgi:glycosyltransferase involved in cell wall biosynthesis
VSVIYFINQYASTPHSGSAGRSFYLAKSLQEKGHEVLLVMSGNHHLLRRKQGFKGLWHKDNYEGLDILWFKTFNYKKANSPLRVLNWFLFALYMPFLACLKLKPSILHYSSPAPVAFIGVWLLSKIIRAKTCLDIRDVWPDTFVNIGGISNRHPLVIMLYWIEKFSAIKADKITSNLSNYSIRLSELGVSSDKFDWIANGVSESDILYSYKYSVITLPEFCNGKFVVAYTGTLGEANALPHLLEAAGLMVENKQIIFLLVGRGKDQPALEKMCKEKKLTNVYFHDAVAKKDIYKLQSLCGVLCVGAKPCSLYKYGVAPNKLYEYMYSGVPVIYYIDSPNYSPVIDAACGEEVSSNDVAGLSEAILRIKNKTPSELETISKSGTAYIKKNHIYADLANKIIT